MKNLKYIVITLIISSIGNSLSAQIKGNQPYSGSSIPASSAFLDASVTNTINNANLGKGLIFPRADLTQLVLSNQGTLYNASNNPNRFDGMIVYNTTPGTTPATGSGVGGQAVVAGYYYFSNPGRTTSTANGEWLPLKGGASNAGVNILTSETLTNTSINNAQIYAVKGTFTASGASTAVNIPSPNGMTGMYGITIYKTGSSTVYSRDLYSYTLGTTAGNAVTGSQSMSVVYPAGTYDYVLEYLKS